MNVDVIWLKDLLKYRLSTALLLTTIVAISLGWWIDHTSRNRRDIVGTWYYPTGDFIQLGYTTTLEIRADGTFTKKQKYRTGSSTYDGTYSTNENGTVTFNVHKRINDSLIGEMLPDFKPTITEFDAAFRCRCGVDKTGYLIIDDYGMAPFAKDTGIQWETYMPKNAR